MKTHTAIIVFILAFITQATWLRFLAINDITPNLLLCLVIVFTFLYNKPYGVLFGVLLGFLWDMNFGIYMGVSSASLLIVAITILIFKKPFNSESILPAIIAGIIGSVLFSCIYLSVYKLMGAPHSISYLLKPQPYLILYNVVIVMVFHIILRRSIIRNKRREYYGSGYNMIGRFQAKGKKWVG